MTKVKTTILLVTLLLLSLVAGFITLTPISAQFSEPKLKLIERSQYWERYYSPERGTYTLIIHASSMSAADPSITISPPTDDSYVREDYPSDNYGTSSCLELADKIDGNRRAYVKFDLSPIPSGSKIISAKLKLYYYYYYSSWHDPAGKTVSAYRVLEDWDESTITWNNQPSYDSTPTASTEIPSYYAWLEWDVTDDVQGMVYGTYDNYGWCIRFATEDLTDSYSLIRFFSKEHDGSDPKLYVEYIPPLTVNLTLVNKNDALSEGDYFQATYTFKETQHTAQLVNGTNTLTIDYDTWIYVEQSSHLSNSTHRWAMNSTFNETFTENATRTLYYWRQCKVTWHLVKAHQNFTDTSSSNYFNASGQQFNSSLTLSLYTGADVTKWVDYGTTITISSLSSASSSSHRWVSGGESYTITAGGTYQFTYQEYVKQYIGKKILDADGDDDITDSISLILIQNAWNGSAIQVEPGDSGWIHYNITHRIYRIKWRGIWVDLRSNHTLTPTSPNYKYNFTAPDIWLLGDSEIEWYLKSSSGSEVYTWIWGENTETLVVIQGKNRGDEVYFYYGGYGKSPQYVYVDGGLVENYALEEDPSLQLMHIPFPAERVDLDFSGESRKAETSVTQLTGMMQQILRQLDMIRIGMLSFVNITQPTGPTIRIPTIDFSKLTAHIYAWINTYSPIKAALLIPILMFLGSFVTLYTIARKLGLKRPEHPPAGHGETVVVVKRERPSVQSIMAKSAATSLAAALITLILSKIFPAYFGQPGSLQLTIAAMVLASILVAFIAWLAAGRREVYRGSRR